MEETSFFAKVQEVFANLFNSQALMATLSKQDFTIVAFVALTLIVFTETGLLIGFFLPGDSLLVTAGLVCGQCGWSLPLLLGILCVAAILGDSVGYSIGYKTGPKIFNRDQSWFFHKDHLLKAQEFYERHGGKTIILARFVPILRTFAPVVAGVGQMEYRRFLLFNVFGGIGWVCSMVLVGYGLSSREFEDLVIKPLFGEGVKVQDHIEKVILVVVFLSISPGIVAWLRAKLRGAAKPKVVAARVR